MIIKKAQVWKSTNFDVGLYDITGFLWTLIISETVEKGQANHSIKRPIFIPKIY